MSLWIILDVAVVAIYLLTIMHFRKKGFLKASETIISLILTVCLMTTALPFFETLLAESSIGKGIVSGVTEFLVPEETEQPEKTESALPDFMQQAVDKNLEKLDSAKNDMLEATAQETSKVIVKILATILLFLIVKLLIFLVFRLLELFCHIRLLKFANNTLGIILGVINATILVYLLCAVVAVCLPVEWSAPIKEAMGETFIAQLFYNHNILMQIFI